jgi:hypothetical protein
MRSQDAAIFERGNPSRPLAQTDSDATSLAANAVGEQRECARKRSSRADHWGSSEPLVTRSASALAKETPKEGVIPK